MTYEINYAIAFNPTGHYYAAISFLMKSSECHSEMGIQILTLPTLVSLGKKHSVYTEEHIWALK